MFGRFYYSGLRSVSLHPPPLLPLLFSVYVSLPLPISACCCLFMLLFSVSGETPGYPAASATEIRFFSTLPPVVSVSERIRFC